MKLLLSFVVVGATSLAISHPVLAQENTPEPTPVVVSLDGTWPQDLDEPVIRWEPAGGAAYYQLEAMFIVVRVNAADPLCSAPLEEDRRTLTFDEALDGDSIEFDLGLPSLPEQDTWLIVTTDVTLTAFNESDQRIAQGGASGKVETNTSLLCATPTPEIGLPLTGSGPGARAWTGLALASAALSLGVMLLATHAFMRRRR